MAILLVLLAGCLALLGFAPAPFPKPSRQRSDPGLLGTWEFVRWEVGGVRHRPQEKAFLLLLTKDRLTLQIRKDGRVSSTFLLRLDPSASPPAFSLRRPEDRWVAFVGSYRLKGGELTLIFDGGADLAKRPTNFSGIATCKYVLRRHRR